MPALEAYDRTGASLALEGPSRAAVLLLALGPTGAGRILRHLNHDEIRALRKGAATQAPVSAQELDALVTEFQEAFKVGPGLSALDREMQRLLQETLAEDDLTAVLGEEDGGVVDLVPDERPLWPTFEERGADAVRAIVAVEHPQIAATILTRLTPETAALVVGTLDTGLRNDILRRMLGAKPLSARAEILFETGLREVHLVADESAGRSRRHVGFADIVNRMDKSQAEELLGSLAETRPEDFEAIRRLLFAFEDLPTLTRRALLVLFDAVQSETVTTALIGAEEPLRETVLGSLAARARRMVEAELSQPREIDPADILAARRSIAALALRLANEGRIALSAPSTDG